MTRRAACFMLLLVPVAACTSTRSQAAPDKTCVEGLLLAPDAPRYLVCGHRGDFFGALATGGANTRAACARGVREGADLVEVDVRATADGLLVATHSDWPARKSAAAWRAEGRRLQSMEEILRWAAGRVVVVLDVKMRDIRPIAALVRRLSATHRVLFLAGDPTEYARMRAAGSEFYIMVRAKSGADVERWLASGDKRIPAIHGDYSWLTPALVGKIHASGKRVFVNSYRVVWHQELFGAQASARRCFEKGIDIVQTNRPASASRARDACAGR